MSAESPRKSSRQGGHVVAPQPVSDRSIIESVAGFINEVVPQAYASTPHGEGKDTITWARFEYGDINDPSLYPDTADDRNSSPPLILVLGYGSGVQVWAIPASGEATEVLSWRQGVVRTLRILPTPGSESNVSDAFAHKRPLVAMCDSAGGPSPQFCSLSFISLRGGDQVKNIKFKNPVSDVLANRRSVVVTFPERIAVFDASTLEDRLTVTTCYPCLGPNPNPVALGSRWLAYSERKLMPAHRSSGGTEGEGVHSYTATMLHAAKSFGKGLRELGETVASSLTGGTGTGMQRGMVGGMCGPVGSQQSGNIMGGGSDSLQPGVITILDALGTSSSGHVEETRSSDSMNGNSDCVIAHFLAHSEPIVAVSFDPSGMLLLTADKRGHDFHVFRIHSHPGGSSLAAVHHLYILHRGDTTAKVQDIAFAADSRWVAVSTLRGTTHVFPITPYGGPVGIRTHATPHVVNRLSRFHRSAGLTADGRNSPVPIPVSETVSTPPSMPYPNPRLPPYTHPTVISPLAQIRQPMTHTLLSASATTSLNPASQQTYHRNPSMRSLGRTQSSSDDGLPGGIPLRVAACFAPPRAWLLGSPTVPRDTPAKAHKRAVDSLFVVACHGNLIEYDLEPRHAAGIPKEKICDDTAIELEVQAKAQWMLLRPPHSSDLQPPLSPTNPLMVLPDRLPTSTGSESRQDDSDSDERWLSQVEIVTHAGPHRRLWMGPQFTFKTYNSSGSGIPLSLLEMEAVEVGVGSGSRPARSNPVNMPVGSGSRPVVPVLIESGSGSSYEQSPRLLEAYGTDGGDSDGSAGPGETQLREDLADAMMESPGVPTRDTGRRVIVEMRHGGLLEKKSSNPIRKVVNPVGTVITISCSSEEGHSSQISDLVEYETSSDAESTLRSSSDAKSRVRISETAKSKSFKTLATTEELMLWNSGEKVALHKEDSHKETTVKWPAAKQIDSTSNLGTKSKSLDASVSKDYEIRTQKKDKNSGENVLDKIYEEKVSKWSRMESKTNLKAIEIQDVESDHSSSYIKQKECEIKGENEEELKSKVYKTSRKSDSEAKEENGNKNSKEVEGKAKTKVLEASKCRETSNTVYKKQSSENSKKVKKLDGSLVQETVLKEVPKWSTRLKTTLEEKSKITSGDESQSHLEENKQTECSDTSPEAAEFQDVKDVKDEGLQVAAELEKFTVSSINLGIKKTGVKSRESKFSKYVSSSNESITSSECKKDKEKIKPPADPLSTLLDETLSEYHFGEELGSTDSTSVLCPEKSESERMPRVMDIRLNKNRSEMEAVSIKENISYKSVLEKVTIIPPKSWSSIVSSSKSTVKESAETSLMRLSEHFSSDVALPESAPIDKIEDTDDCSDEGEEKSRNSGNETIAAIEDSTFAVGNEDESNGNDDDAADNGTTATLGNNKKNRRTKKKRR